MSKDILLDYLSRILEKSGEHLSRFILIGGYASLLYNLKMEEEPPVFTTDLDLLMEETNETDRVLEEKLKELKFEIEISKRGETKFRNHTWKENQGIDFEIEFLIPKIGHENREHKNKSYGITPQSLRFLDILLENCWSFDFKGGKKIKIPHPARYLIQKLLSYERRKEKQKRENDIRYIANIIDLFSDEDRITILTTEINQIFNTPRRKWIKKAVNNYEKLFLRDPSPGIEILLKYSTPQIIDRAKYQAEFFLEHLQIK